MKFKVGDKVIVDPVKTKDCSEGHAVSLGGSYGRLSWLYEMDQHRGEAFSITVADPDNTYRLNGIHFYWHESWLTLVEDPNDLDELTDDDILEITLLGLEIE